MWAFPKMIGPEKAAKCTQKWTKPLTIWQRGRAGLILISGFSPCTSYGRSGSWVVLLVGTAVVRTDLDDRCLSSGPSRCSQLCVLSGRCTYHLEWKRSLAVRVPKWKHQLAPIVEHRQFEDLEGPTTTTGSDFYKGDNVCQLWQS